MTKAAASRLEVLDWALANVPTNGLGGIGWYVPGAVPPQGWMWKEVSKARDDYVSFERVWVLAPDHPSLELGEMIRLFDVQQWSKYKYWLARRQQQKRLRDIGRALIAVGFTGLLAMLLVQWLQRIF